MSAQPGATGFIRFPVFLRHVVRAVGSPTHFHFLYSAHLLDLKLLSGIPFLLPEIHFREHPSVMTCSWPVQFCVKRLRSLETGKRTLLCTALLAQRRTQLLRPPAAAALLGTPAPKDLSALTRWGLLCLSLHGSIVLLSTKNLFLFLFRYCFKPTEHMED